MTPCNSMCSQFTAQSFRISFATVSSNWRNCLIALSGICMGMCYINSHVHGACPHQGYVDDKLNELTKQNALVFHAGGDRSNLFKWLLNVRMENHGESYANYCGYPILIAWNVWMFGSIRPICICHLKIWTSYQILAPGLLFSYVFSFHRGIPQLVVERGETCVQHFTALFSGTGSHLGRLQKGSFLKKRDTCAGNQLEDGAQFSFWDWRLLSSSASHLMFEDIISQLSSGSLLCEDFNPLFLGREVTWSWPSTVTRFFTWAVAPWLEKCHFAISDPEFAHGLGKREWIRVKIGRRSGGLHPLGSLGFSTLLELGFVGPLASHQQFDFAPPCQIVAAAEHSPWLWSGHGSRDFCMRNLSICAMSCEGFTWGSVRNLWQLLNKGRRCSSVASNCRFNCEAFNEEIPVIWPLFGWSIVRLLPRAEMRAS